MIYYYERKRQNRAMCYLVSEKDVNAFIEELNKIQNAQKVFFNVGVKPYKGKRYSTPAKTANISTIAETGRAWRAFIRKTK